jgi:hypothetical protein
MHAAAALRADCIHAFTAFTVRSATCRTVCAVETRVNKTLIASKEQQVVTATRLLQPSLPAAQCQGTVLCKLILPKPACFN